MSGQDSAGAEPIVDEHPSDHEPEPHDWPDQSEPEPESERVLEPLVSDISACPHHCHIGILVIKHQQSPLLGDAIRGNQTKHKNFGDFLGGKRRHQDGIEDDPDLVVPKKRHQEGIEDAPQTGGQFSLERMRRCPSSDTLAASREVAPTLAELAASAADPASEALSALATVSRTVAVASGALDACSSAVANQAVRLSGQDQAG